MSIRRYFIVIVFLSGAFLSQAYSQCSMCRAVLESEEGQNKAEAINDGIVYLMALPYIAVGLVFYMVYRIKFGKRKA
jgi:hypothetical protein